MHMLFLAEIPVFDWRGPEFLVFYGVALFVAIVWSYLRGRRLSDRFDSPGAPADLGDPFEAAFLAGGAPRAQQTAVCCLLRKGLIEWRKSTLSGRFVAVSDAATLPLSPLERDILSAIRGSRKGLKLAELGTHVGSQLSALEARVAAAGLRPTRNELSGNGLRICLPVVFVMILGVIKLFIGLSREKPVGFLLIALLISFVAAAAVAGLSQKKAGHLTPAGKDLLDRMREKNNAAPKPNSAMDDLPAWAMSIALFGPLADPWIAGQQALAQELSRIQSAQAAAASGGCGTSGCSSGCGGSGCGGGCGGCGGD